MSIKAFKNQVMATFSIQAISPEITDAEWQEYANKVSIHKPEDVAEAKSLFMACFPSYSYSVTYNSNESIDNTDLNALLMLAISLSTNEK